MNSTETVGFPKKCFLGKKQKPKNSMTEKNRPNFFGVSVELKNTK